MLINEITDAQGQLELLRTVIDNTWTAIAQQAEQENRAEAELKANLKSRGKKSSKGTSLRIPTPPPSPPKQPQAPLAKQPPSPLNTPNPIALSAVNLNPSTNPQLNHPPKNTTANPKLASTLYPKPITKNRLNQQNDVKDGYFGKNIGTKEKEDDGDDRYSKNLKISQN